MKHLGVVLFLLALLPLNSLLVDGAWQTLSGTAPLVIAKGGTSGLYPDQTGAAFQDAITYSLPGVILSCDLQIAETVAGALQGLCRTGLDLGKSTNIGFLYAERNKTYSINGINVTGWFAVDFTAEDILLNVTAVQASSSRPTVFDGLLPIFTPESVSSNSPLWLNSESTSFFEEHGLNMTEYLLAFTEGPVPASFLSVNEVTVLRKLQSAASTAGTKLIFKFLDKASVEPTTNQTYGALLSNLSDIATFASGILVPKSYIWPRDNTSTLLEPHTSLVDDAHKANLEVYAYDFFNDEYPFPYNYSFDPVVEILDFTEKYNFSVDGVFTDFPSTASLAIACYASNSLNASKTGGGTKKTVISHNGNSGDWPGCTLPAYTSAIAAGVDYIDCSVQITKDGVLICRESPDLTSSTNVAAVPSLFQNYLESYPELDGDTGVYTFDLTWSQIESNLKPIISSPSFNADILRDQSHDGLYDILTLAEFLSLAKNNSVGVFIDIQNAVYLRQKKNLAVVDGVVEALKAAGYTDPSEKVILQSEDSSALARLRTLNVTYPLTYRIAYTISKPVSVTADDFVDIKAYATAVSIPRRLIEPLIEGFLLGPSQVVQWAHAQNLTAYFFFLRNEPTVFAFDLKGDPTIEMLSLTERYKIDGFITDFPTTAINYLGNHCLSNGTGTSNINFTIPDVVPGLLYDQITSSAPTPAPAPAPDLVVPEAPLTGPVPISPSPSPVPAAASHLSTCLFLSAAFSVLLHTLAVL